MFTTVKNAFKVKEIRSRLLYTVLALLIVRIGCALPVPGIDRTQVAGWMANFAGKGFLDSLTGGSLSHLSIFSLNISPYITSSIIMQLLTIVFPKLEELAKDGTEGHKKISEYTRYLAVVLAIVESVALIIGFGNQGILEGGLKFSTLCMTTLAFTAGSTFLMWLGEQITEKGIGNGISIILLINIVSGFPGEIKQIFTRFVVTPTAPISKVIGVAGIVIVALLIVVMVVLLQDAERKIPVQNAQKVQGRKLVGSQGSFIPLKINTANVIPVIFALSLMQTPVIVLSFVGITAKRGSFWEKVAYLLTSSNWFDFSSWGEFKYTLGALIFIVLLFVFAFFYTSITFNPMEVANNLKKQGGFIPGIRPGRPTTEYLTKILNYVTTIGSVGLLIVCLIPMIVQGANNMQLGFGGTSVIIIVSVIVETLKQVDSMLLVRQYKGFLND